MSKSSSFKNFDKCEECFDDPKVTKRVRALIIDNPKLVLFLMNPVKAAYSCFKVFLIYN